MKSITLWMLLLGWMYTTPLWTHEHPDPYGEEEEMEEIEETVMEYIHKVEPRAVKPMEEFEEEDEEEYWEIILEVAEALEEIEDIKEEAPEFAAIYERILQAEIRMEYLGDAIWRAESDAEKEALTDELKRLLPVAFEDRMKEAEMEIEYLREELNMVEADWKRRKANKEKIIERRFKELTDGYDDLDW